MKKSMLAFLLMVVLVMASGCKKDKSESTPTTTGLSLKFDGTTWTASLISGFYYSETGITYIMAGNNLAQQVQFSFIGNGTGTYNLIGNDFDNFGIFVTGTGEFDDYSTLSGNDGSILGKVVVTEYDKTNHTISGTFYFDGYNDNALKKTFSEGIFTKISYQPL